MQYYTSLREANIARQKEWVGKAPPVDLSFRSNEMMGEVGEVLELIGGRIRDAKWPDGLGSELADVLITADLLMLDAGMGALPMSGEPLRGYGPLRLATMLGAHAGKVANVVKKLERERLGFAGSTSDRIDLLGHMRSMMAVVTTMAEMLKGVDIIGKFNATSEKLGFQTRLLDYPGYSIFAEKGEVFDVVSSWTEALNPGETFTPMPQDQAREATFDTLEELAKLLHNEGDTALEGELRASFARGTGGVDIDRVVDILTVVHNTELEKAMSALNVATDALDTSTHLNDRLTLRLTTIMDDLGRLLWSAAEPLD
jgi:hypothetical protein